ncbi:MAG: hypothetical protein JNJ83_02160 [Verrucomicrobiaceae bacterium]|nr:hypothetical protein [Verrucomicrobiaceae bacterium]
MENTLRRVPAESLPFRWWFFYLLLVCSWTSLKPYFANPDARYWTPEIVMSDKDGVPIQEKILIDSRTYARLNNEPEYNLFFWVFGLEVIIFGGGRLMMFLRSKMMPSGQLAESSSGRR